MEKGIEPVIMDNKDVLIRVRNLSCKYSSGKKEFVAINNVNFDILDEEIITIVGESGSGKTTLARILLQLQKRSEGEILFKGQKITEKKDYWKDVQAIFQDPFASFNQFYTVYKQMNACFNLSNIEYSEKDKMNIVIAALEKVNLDPDDILEKYPFELSGGQLQRLLIARIFIVRPKVLIADEPTSMFDIASRVSILDLLLRLKEELKMCIVFITHDIGLAYYVSDRIFVMSKGKILESGSPEEITGNPQHNYTKKLLYDIPVIGQKWLSEDDFKNV